jgi:inorganic pyrophosphatase
MQTETFIGQILRIEIDRPLGSRHPRHGFIYPINYGCLPGVPAPDGEDLDAYILGVSVPVHEFTGMCIAVIRRLDDDDDKLVIASVNSAFTDEDIRTFTHFQEQFFHSLIIRKPVQA